MKFFRYRRPSLKTMLGITKEKKRLKKELGITEMLKPFRWWGNEKRDIKRHAGYYSRREVPARWLAQADGLRGHARPGRLAGSRCCFVASAVGQHSRTHKRARHAHRR